MGLRLRTTLKRFSRNAVQPFLIIRDRPIIAALDIPHQPRGAEIKASLTWPGREFSAAELKIISDIEESRRKLEADASVLIGETSEEVKHYDSGRKICDAARASKPRRSALTLYKLVRNLRPIEALELGTNIGISSAYISAALQSAEDGGRVSTLEASPYRLKVARDLHKQLGLGNISYHQGFFSEILESVLEELGCVDFAFIDGNHQYEPTLDYFERILSHATEDAVFVFDDIRWSDGMKNAWRDLSSDPRFGLVVDLGSVGICVRSKEDQVRRHVSSQIMSAC